MATRKAFSAPGMVTPTASGPAMAGAMSSSRMGAGVSSVEEVKCGWRKVLMPWMEKRARGGGEQLLTTSVAGKTPVVLHRCYSSPAHSATSKGIGLRRD